MEEDGKQELVLEYGVSKDKNHAANKEFIQKQFDFHDNSHMTSKIRATQKKYVNALQGLGIEDLEKKSLAELKDLMDVHKVQVSTKRKRDWLSHEIDVVNGVNKLFQEGLYVIVRDGNETDLLDKKNAVFKAEQAGGATQSDVKVVHGKRMFFIECKLNFEAAEYFKYGLRIRGSQIKYDHKKYIEGLDASQKQDEIDKINQLFTKDIDISSFLNKIVNDSKVKAGWDQFLKNATDVEEFIMRSDEFKDFTSKAKFTQTWPDDFKGFVKVFDTYADYYVRLYDRLMVQLFTYFDSDDLDIEDYQIQQHDTRNEKHVFSALAGLQEEIENLSLEVYNQRAFTKTVKQIATIEAKFNALLKAIGHEGDVSQVTKLSSKEKTKYFFKMFISSVGKKSQSNEYNNLTAEDELGNMQICSRIILNTDELAKLITTFYVKKDRCAYIQIADVIYQFDRDLNPLALDKLPLFSQCMTSFTVVLNISDDLKRIGLHVKAMPPDPKKLAGCARLSFKEKDSNYILKKYHSKAIKIELH